MHPSNIGDVMISNARFRARPEGFERSMDHVEADYQASLPAYARATTAAVGSGEHRAATDCFVGYQEQYS